MPKNTEILNILDMMLKLIFLFLYVFLILSILVFSIIACSIIIFLFLLFVFIIHYPVTQTDKCQALTFQAARVYYASNK